MIINTKPDSTQSSIPPTTPISSPPSSSSSEKIPTLAFPSNSYANLDEKKLEQTFLQKVNALPAQKTSDANLNLLAPQEEILHSQERRIPPLGIADTVIFKNGEIQSVHGSGELFSDEEIKEKLGIVKKVEITPNSQIYAEYTKHEKPIIQQQATRGCTAAVAAMLIMDQGKTPDIVELTTRNLANEEYQIRDIQRAGLIPIQGVASSLSELRNLILQDGSCIVSVNGKIGAHVVVVDEVSEDLSEVRLRDPYHGWEITVTKEAFLNEWGGLGETMQARTP